MREQYHLVKIELDCQQDQHNTRMERIRHLEQELERWQIRKKDQDLII